MSTKSKYIRCLSVQPRWWFILIESSVIVLEKVSMFLQKRHLKLPYLYQKNSLSLGWYVMAKGTPVTNLLDLFLFWLDLTCSYCKSVISSEYPLSKNHEFISWEYFLKCFSKEQMLFNLGILLQMMEFLICSGCEELQWRYWWQSVLLVLFVCKSLKIILFLRLYTNMIRRIRKLRITKAVLNNSIAKFYMFLWWIVR